MKEAKEDVKVEPIDTSKSYLNKNWDVHEDWLSFYDLIPVDIPSLDTSPEHQDLDKSKPNMPRPRIYQYLEHLDVLPNDDALATAFGAIINMFLRAGIRVVDISSDTLRNI